MSQTAPARARTGYRRHQGSPGAAGTRLPGWLHRGAAERHRPPGLAAPHPQATSPSGTVYYRQVLRSRQAVANHKRKEPPVLRQVAEGVLIHESEFCQSNAVVVHGRAGVLLIDPGVHGYEMACLANDLRELGQPVVAGFSTHPHWDHLLWHARLGAAPRYGTARCAATVRDRLSDPRWKARIAELDTAGHRRAGTAGPARPHYRPARRDGADSLGWPSSPDCRASGACPGPCGAVDRGTRGSRRRRHAF